MMKIKKNIVIMYAISFLQGMVFYSAVATLYRQAAGLTVFQISLIESISLVLSVALELPWGILSEKIGYRYTMIVCSILFLISKVVFWQAEGFGMFLLERVLLSITIAGLSGVDSSVLYLSCEESYIQKAFGIYNSMGTAGMMTAVGIYSLFLHGDYRRAAYFTIIAYGFAAAAAFFLQEVKEGKPAQNGSPVREFAVILKDTVHKKELLLLVIGTALFSQCHQTITVFLNQLQYIKCGVRDDSIGWIYVLVTVAGLFSSRSASFSSRFGKRKSGLILLTAGAGACLLLAGTKNLFLSVLAVMVLRITYSLFMPLAEALENQFVTHSNRATALSIHAIFMDGVAIATNLVMGKAADYSLSFTFIMAAVFCIAAAVLFCYSSAFLIHYF